MYDIRERFLEARGLGRPSCADDEMQRLLTAGDPLPEYDTLFAGADDEYLISRNQARFLKRIVTERRIKNIVEFGAGASSLIFASALSETGGGALTSVEERPEWCAETWEKVLQCENVDARLVPSKLRLRIDRKGFYFAYPDARAAIAERGPFDLVLIDAPQWCYGRDGGLHSVYPYLKPGAAVILDDAARIMERWTLFRWLSLYPDLRLVLFRPDYAKGLAVLTKTGERGSRLSPGAFATSLYHVYKHRKFRRQLRW